MDFKTAAELLDQAGVLFNQEHEYRGEVGPNRGPVNLPLFKSIKVPFTPEEWCSTTMSEADHYLGGCCGNLSAVQDEWNHIFRIGGGWIDAKKLGEIAESLGAHDGFETWTPKHPDDDIRWRVETFSTLDPWGKVELIWQIIREHYRPEVPFAAHDHIKGAERPISVLARSLYAMDMHLMCDRMDQQDQEPQLREPRDEAERLQRVKDQADRQSFRRKRAEQGKARKMMILYRVIPALNELQATIAGLGLEPFQGWAIWDKEAKDVASTHMGQCFYETREHIDELFDLWRKDEAEHTERASHYVPVDTHLTVRPVRISVEKGVEFLD